METEGPEIAAWRRVDRLTIVSREARMGRITHEIIEALRSGTGVTRPILLNAAELLRTTAERSFVPAFEDRPALRRFALVSLARLEAGEEMLQALIHELRQVAEEPEKESGDLFSLLLAIQD